MPDVPGFTSMMCLGIYDQPSTKLRKLDLSKTANPSTRISLPWTPVVHPLDVTT
jgi:hypothetical protein